MKRRNFLAGLTSLLVPPVVRAQSGDYPSRPLRIIVPFLAGSGSDSAARVFGELLTRSLGQPVTVENRPGANGVIGLQALKQAPADGYTLAIGSSSMTVNPFFMKSLPYTVDDFRPVTGLASAPAAFVVGAGSPYRTLGDFVAAARREKRDVKVGTYTNTYQLGIAWLAQLAGIEATTVLYKGAAPIVTDLIGGHLELAFVDASAMGALLSEGKLRMLATAGAARLPQRPDVPTVKESFPEFEFHTWISLIVRAETPDPIVAKLSALLDDAKQTPAAQEYYAKTGLTPSALSARTMLQYQSENYRQYQRIAERAGIRPE